MNGEGLEKRIDAFDKRIDAFDKRIGELEKPRRDWVASLISSIFSFLSVVVSVLSLFISGATFFILEVPERLNAHAVELIMPPEARLAQIQNETGNQTYSVRVYLQPAFVSTGRSQRVAVVKSVNLFVKQEGEQQCCEKVSLDGIGSLTSNARLVPCDT